ncbi:MAG: 2-amino-4-hydroxy-6-hydroxymethyldihydropteridine diphosphokinase [Lentisphaeria bacterium]|jgi:2-amino-4-hydroxy-6-hydroxymethyldihydropteridine diphosphokinase
MASADLRNHLDTVVTPVALGLGANLGDPAAALAAALAALRRGGVRKLRLSAVRVTVPVDCVPGTPPFHNAAATGEWGGTAVELLALCHRIERELGRPARHSPREARVIDLDILLFGGAVLRLPGLEVPHPRLLGRRFALEPLAELAADWPIPGTGLTVGEALARLGRG